MSLEQGKLLFPLERYANTGIVFPGCIYQDTIGKYYQVMRLCKGGGFKVRCLSEGEASIIYELPNFYDVCLVGDGNGGIPMEQYEVLPP